MTNDYDKLRAMNACYPALRWIGDRTIEQAWSNCKQSEWMCWLLRKIAPNDQRCRLAAADFAERVWHLIPDEPTKLAAAWAIGAARRGDKDEMDAAAYAAYAAATNHAAYAAAAAAPTASIVAASSEHAANAAAVAAATSAAATSDDATSASYTIERSAQADILRKYFSAREIGELWAAA